MIPKVSICVPNLNMYAFLDERFQTILQQSFQDWELLVYDSYSDDGAWEYLCALAAREPRMRAWQGPREGAPGSWNPCIRQARGEYVYIATSDDTMPPDCLATLVAALDAHPECDIAHCRLRCIDEHGHDLSDWWSRISAFARSSGTLLKQAHIRNAPFDGLLHLAGESVYISITQLLIRRSLFERVGLFQRTWGSVGDFNWSMRAGLVANTVHVPNTWGGWRIHNAQATATAGLRSAEHSRKIEAMIEDALEFCQTHLPAPVRDRLYNRWAPEAKDFRTFDRGIRDRQDAIGRRVFIAGKLCAGSAPAWEHARSKLLRRSAWQDRLPERAALWLNEVGFGPALLPASGRVVNGAVERFSPRATSARL